MQHRYLCERCGGTGHQEAGCWSGKAYDSKEGTCESCGGTGYLGSKGYSHADIDEFSGYLFHGCQLLTMAEVAKRLNDAPRWMDRPDRPGTWICLPKDCGPGMFSRFLAMDLSQADIDKGVPFRTSRVYGPIPEDK